MSGVSPQGGQENHNPPRWGDRPTAIGFQPGHNLDDIIRSVIDDQRRRIENEN